MHGRFDIYLSLVYEKKRTENWAKALQSKFLVLQDQSGKCSKPYMCRNRWWLFSPMRDLLSLRVWMEKLVQNHSVCQRRSQRGFLSDNLRESKSIFYNMLSKIKVPKRVLVRKTWRENLLIDGSLNKIYLKPHTWKVPWRIKSGSSVESFQITLLGTFTFKGWASFVSRTSYAWMSHQSPAQVRRVLHSPFIFGMTLTSVYKVTLSLSLSQAH